MVYAMPLLRLASADWMTRSNVRHGCSYSEAVVGRPALACSRAGLVARSRLSMKQAGRWRKKKAPTRAPQLRDQTKNAKPARRSARRPPPAQAGCGSGCGTAAAGRRTAAPARPAACRRGRIGIAPGCVPVAAPPSSSRRRPGS